MSLRKYVAPTCSLLLSAGPCCSRAARAPAADPYSLLLHAASAYNLAAAALAPAADPDSMLLHGTGAHAVTSATLEPAADPRSLPRMLLMLMPCQLLHCPVVQTPTANPDANQELYQRQLSGSSWQENEAPHWLSSAIQGVEVSALLALLRFHASTSRQLRIM